jgi:hypothetical protein
MSNFFTFSFKISQIYQNLQNFHIFSKNPVNPKFIASTFIITQILDILLSRFSDEQKDNQRRSIRFDRDPEWQADEKVVLFEEFYEG